MSETFRSRLVDPRLKNTSFEMMDSWQTLNFLAIKDRQLFPFNGSSKEMLAAQQGIWTIGSYGKRPKQNWFYAQSEAGDLTTLLNVLRRASNILPQRYTHDTGARSIIDGVLGKHQTYPHFSAFRAALDAQRACVESQLKSRFPTHDLT